MAEVIVFHHALGVTDPVRRFADALRDAGHTVHTPDLYDGQTFDTIEDGMAHSEEIGGPTAIVDRARAAVECLPTEVVYVGFSLGVLAAQSLAQTRRAWCGALLRRPAARRVGRQLAGRCSTTAAPPGGRRGLRGRAGTRRNRAGAELLVYHGTEHYFAEHDDQAAALLTQRVLEFLG